MKLKKIQIPFIIIGLTLLASLCVSAQEKPEIYAKVSSAVGNIAFNSNGDLVYSHHPLFNPAVRVMHYNSITQTSEPFPNKAWNTRRKTDDLYLDDVLGIHNDSKGVVWMLDMGLKSNITPKLVGWNTKKNTLEHLYYIPQPASILTSQLNDFVLDESRKIVVIADEGIANNGDGSKAALVILNLNTGQCRRVLEGHRTTVPENIPIVVRGKQFSIPGSDKPVKVGADGITLDKNNEWLYYAPLNGKTVYRIKMVDLLNETYSDDDLDRRIETYAAKENNGGLSIDTKNNLYLTYVGSQAIGVIPSADKKSYHYAVEDRMVWPDGVSYNKDGYMYVSAAQLPLGEVFNDGVDKTTKPFYIFRFKPVAKGIWGR